MIFKTSLSLRITVCVLMFCVAGCVRSPVQPDFVRDPEPPVTSWSYGLHMMIQAKDSSYWGISGDLTVIHYSSSLSKARCLSFGGHISPYLYRLFEDQNGMINLCTGEGICIQNGDMSFSSPIQIPKVFSGNTSSIRYSVGEEQSPWVLQEGSGWFSVHRFSSTAGYVRIAHDSLDSSTKPKSSQAFAGRADRAIIAYSDMRDYTWLLMYDDDVLIKKYRPFGSNQSVHVLNAAFIGIDLYLVIRNDGTKVADSIGLNTRGDPLRLWQNEITMVRIDTMGVLQNITNYFFGLPNEDYESTTIAYPSATECWMYNRYGYLAFSSDTAVDPKWTAFRASSGINAFSIPLFLSNGMVKLFDEATRRFIVIRQPD